MRLFKNFVVLSLSIFTFSFNSCSESNSKSYLTQLEAQGFKVEAVNVSNTESYVAYKVEDYNVNFNTDTKSVLTLKSIWYFQDGDIEEVEKEYSTPLAGHVISLPSFPLQVDGDRVTFDYFIYTESDELAEEKTILLSFPY